MLRQHATGSLCNHTISYRGKVIRSAHGAVQYDDPHEVFGPRCSAAQRSLRGVRRMVQCNTMILMRCSTHGALQYDDPYEVFDPMV